MSVNNELNVLKQPINSRAIRLDDDRIVYFRGNTVFSLNVVTGESESRDFLSAKARIIAIATHPKFGVTGANLMAFGVDNGMVYVYDFEQDHLYKAHGEHKNKLENEWMGLHMTNDGTVLSVVGKTLVKFCTISKKISASYRIQPRKFSATEMSGTALDPDLLAIGSYCGLLVIVSIKDLIVKHLFRGHDHKVSSIIWMRNISGGPLDEDDDCFDVYNDDHFRDDFGVEKKSAAPSVCLKDTPVESPPVNNKFDFVEACQTLKEEIILQKNEVPFSTPQRPTQPSAEECTKSPLNDSNVSLSSGSSNLENMFEKIDINEEAEDLTMVTLDQNMNVWVWDVRLNCAKGSFRISSKSHSNQSGQAGNKHPAQMFALGDNRTIVGNTSNGTLFSLNLLFDAEKNKVDYDFQLTKNISVVLAPVEKNKFLAYYPYHAIRLMEYVSPSCAKQIREFPVYNSMGRSIAVCEANPMRVAIGTHELCFFDLTTTSDTSCSFTTNHQNTKSSVVCLAWHPELEVLAFGTMEGRIGLYNSQKNSVDLLRPFSGAEIYDLAFSKVGDEFQLFACCANGTCVRYYKNFSEFSYIFKTIKGISALYVDNVLEKLFVGTKQGEVFHGETGQIQLPNTLRVLKVSRNYIRIIRVNCDHSKVVVVSKNAEICVIPSDKLDAEDPTPHLIRLRGHSQPIVHVDVSRTDPNLILSVSYDSSLRVWDLEQNVTQAEAASEEQQIVASAACYDFDVKLKYAIFSPLNENCIIVGTFATPFYVFNRQAKTGGFPPKIVNEKRIANTRGGSGSATAIQDDIRSLAVASSSTTKSDSSKVNNSKAAAASSSETTVFYMAKRESTKKVMQCLRAMVTDNDGEENVPNADYLNKTIFSSDLEQIKGVLLAELKNYKASNMKSQGTELLALLGCDVKESIVGHIKDKSLTHEMVGIAPMVSHGFWKLCAEAYAMQLIEEGLPLKAVVYLLGIHKVDEALRVLLEKHYYREAWILVKMKKIGREDDPIFGMVAQKWIEYLDLCGDYEYAAVVATGIGEYRQALDELLKRREDQLNDEHRAVIQSLKAKLEGDKKK